jgi:hypothetical protein
MRTRGQAGEGKAGGIIWLAVLAAAIYAGFNTIPPYMANFNLKDQANQIARNPRGSVKDDAILDQLMKATQENDLDGYIQKSCWHVQTLDTQRRITCEYDRVEKIFPGVSHNFHYSIAVEQPLIF